MASKKIPDANKSRLLMDMGQRLHAAIGTEQASEDEDDRMFERERVSESERCVCE